MLNLNSAFVEKFKNFYLSVRPTTIPIINPKKNIDSDIIKSNILNSTHIILFVIYH